MRIGIDTIEISRFADVLQKESFMNRVFSEAELKEFSERGSKPNHIASVFAAKEAFSKAVGTGLAGFSLKEVSLLHKPSGRPYLVLSGAALKLANDLSLLFDVSITHTDELATAVVLAYDDQRLKHD